MNIKRGTTKLVEKQIENDLGGEIRVKETDVGWGKLIFDNSDLQPSVLSNHGLKEIDPKDFEEMIDSLKGRFINETPYVKVGQEVGLLVGEKQEAYGDSFGRSGNILREMYPNGIKPEQYDDMLCLVRIVDKLFRVANKKDAFGESPYRDLVGYGILGTVRDEKNKKESK